MYFLWRCLRSRGAATLSSLPMMPYAGRLPWAHVAPSQRPVAAGV
jgi:hypothetical protein